VVQLVLLCCWLKWLIVVLFFFCRGDLSGSGFLTESVEHGRQLKIDRKKRVQKDEGVVNVQVLCVGSCMSCGVGLLQIYVRG
jgi:hypothetical protein